MLFDSTVTIHVLLLEQHIANNKREKNTCNGSQMQMFSHCCRICWKYDWL